MRGTLTAHGKLLGTGVPILYCPVSNVLQVVPSSALPLSLDFNLPLHMAEGSTLSQTRGWGTSE